MHQYVLSRKKCPQLDIRRLSEFLVSIAQIQPVLEIMEEVMMGLPRALDGRVYVAVGRGLWDFTAKEIYDYVEGLQEGKENKVFVSLFGDGI
jgi:hypothetical protein